MTKAYFNKLGIALSFYFSNYLFNSYLEFVKNKQKHFFFYILNSIFKKITLLFANLIKKNNESVFMIIGRDGVNWAIDKLRENIVYFLRKTNVRITKHILIATHLFCVRYDLLLKKDYKWVGALKNILKFKVIGVVTNVFISRINEFESYTLSKYNDNSVKSLKNIIDVWLVPSTKMYAFLKERGFNVFLFPHFIRSEEFYHLKKSKSELCNELNIDFNKIENKIVIGSFQRDSSALYLEKPRWEKNPDGLINILKNIPRDKFVLLLSGPRRHYIIGECEKYNIPYIFYGDISYIKEKKDDMIVNNQSARKVNLLYNLTDIYIISSHVEGTPQAIYEASLAKTLIFSTDVGIAKDFLHKDLIYSFNNLHPVINSILNFNVFREKIKEYIEYNYNRVQEVLNEKNSVKLFKKLINEKLKIQNFQ